MMRMATLSTTAKEEMKMDVRYQAIKRWGFENARSVVICTLVEDGRAELAEQLFEELVNEE